MKKFCTLKSAVVSVSLFIFVIILLSLSKMNSKLISVEFEVYGRVQGVFFRKYTSQESKKLGLKGWCMNTERGTVQGVLEGVESKVNDMKNWLQYTGSPSSKIEKAEFKNQKAIQQLSFSDFSIRR